MGRKKYATAGIDESFINTQQLGEEGTGLLNRFNGFADDAG